jgi:hypothetical protein
MKDLPSIAVWGILLCYYGFQLGDVILILRSNAIFLYSDIDTPWETALQPFIGKNVLNFYN